VFERPADTPTSSRALPEIHLLATRDHFDLGKFLRASRQRRETYFQLIEETISRMEDFLGRPVPERTLRRFVALALEMDPTFLAFVIGQGGGAELRDPNKHETILEAAAATVVDQYFNAGGETSRR
jgi:hypothetical protein